MKVQEKGTDRRAELRVHVQEQVEELAEYGQYIDPDDQAICCYVPVEDGSVVKVAGRFHGTVSAIISILYRSGFANSADLFCPLGPLCRRSSPKGQQHGEQSGEVSERGETRL